MSYQLYLQEGIARIIKLDIYIYSYITYILIDEDQAYVERLY